MKLLRAISRFVVGILFLVSGFVKIIDPVGGGLVVEEYFKIIGGGDWHTLYLFLGALLSISEMLLGIAILIGLRMRFFSKVALGFILFFTLLTLFLAIFNPITECGCFGEAFKLTNWQTFFKNLILLPFVLLLFFQRDNFILVAPVKWEWIFTLFYLLFLIFLSIYSYQKLPMIDFMEYRVGTDLREELSFKNERYMPSLKTILIYSKEGKEYQFSIDNLPDSTYKFVDSHTITEKPLSSRDFAISNFEGTYLTDSLLSIDGPLFLVTLPHSYFLTPRRAEVVKRLEEVLSERGLPLVLLSGSSKQEVEEMKGEFELDIESYFTDYKTLLTLNRARTGIIYIYSGVIISKWSTTSLPLSRVIDTLNEDPELVSAKVNIKEHLAVEITAFALLIIIAAMRYFLRIFYKYRKDEDREEQKPQEL